MKRPVKCLLWAAITFFTVFAIYLIANAVSIFKFSSEYFETKSDVAIVLGAGTNNGNVSPIFKQRLNHAAYLLNYSIVKSLILTGGYGQNQGRADSEIAREYLMTLGVPSSAINIETKSRYTFENISEANRIMDSLDMKTALIVSDPLHMKRSIGLATKRNIQALPSPTKTTAYKSFYSKAKSLVYETVFYSLGQISGMN